MAVYKRGKVWWYKFTFNTEPIRESSKQTNKRVAEQMEAAHKTALAKGEVGIRERARVLTLGEFAENDFLPFVRATFAAKIKTRTYYESGLKSLLAYGNLASLRLDTITIETMAGFAGKRREQGLSGQQCQSRTSGTPPNLLSCTGVGQGGKGAAESAHDSR